MGAQGHCPQLLQTGVLFASDTKHEKKARLIWKQMVGKKKSKLQKSVFCFILKRQEEKKGGKAGVGGEGQESFQF